MKTKKPLFLAFILVFSLGFLGFETTGTTGVTLKILVSDQQKPILEQRAAAFITANSGVDHIEVIASGSRADDQHQYLVTILSQGDTEFDIVGMDVIWTAEFASNGWLTDLTADYNQSHRDLYLDAHVEAMMYNNKVYAAPFFFDSGLLLYRKDILSRNGFAADASDFGTWTNFQTNLNSILDNKSEIVLNANLEGYVAQGDSYEGGIVNLVEWMGGSDGTFLKDGRGNFESAKPGLEYWKGLIAPRYTIALNNTGTDAVMERTELIGDEGSAVTKWLAGNAVFQRNWPFSYLLSLEDKFLNGTDVTSDWSGGARFGVTTLPYNQTICGVANTVGCGTQALGGAILGIPTASTQVALAKAFLLEIGSAPAQLEMLTVVGNLPALKSVYTDSSIPVAFKYAEDLFANVFSEVIPRPVHPDYAAMSSAIQPIFHDAIAGALSVDEAIVQMNLEVNLILEAAAIVTTVLTSVETIVTTVPTTIISGGETIVTSVAVTIEITKEVTSVITETEANSLSLFLISLSLVMVTVLLRTPRRRK